MRRFSWKILFLSVKSGCTDEENEINIYISLDKIGPVVLNKKIIFVNFVNVFSLFRYYLPLEKVEVLHWKTLNFIHQRMLYVKFGWTGLVVLEKKKM